MPRTYVDKLLKADLPVFVLVPVDDELLNDLSHFVAGKRQVGFLEELVKLVVTDKPIAVEIFSRGRCKRKEQQAEIKRQLSPHSVPLAPGMAQLEALQILFWLQLRAPGGSTEHRPESF